jgi:hypothetical protein
MRSGAAPPSSNHLLDDMLVLDEITGEARESTAAPRHEARPSALTESPDGLFITLNHTVVSAHQAPC